MLKKSIILLLFLGLVQSSVLAASLITVAGQGKTSADPDTVSVNIKVEKVAKLAQTAQTQVSSAINQVISALNKIGIKKDQIETTRISLSPNYDYKNRVKELKSYSASNQINVEIKKIDSIGKIIDTAINNGATSIDSIIFDIRDKENLKKEALKQAFNQAKQKAQAIAQASGMQLISVKEIREGGLSAFPTRVGMDTLAAESFKSEVSTPILPGQVDISAQIVVVYEAR